MSWPTALEEELARDGHGRRRLGDGGRGGVTRVQKVVIFVCLRVCRRRKWPPEQLVDCEVESESYL